MQEGYAENQYMQRALPCIRSHHEHNRRHRTSKIPLAFRLLAPDSSDVAAHLAKQKKKSEDNHRWKGSQTPPETAYVNDYQI
jgi:hypothetical protein